MSVEAIEPLRAAELAPPEQRYQWLKRYFGSWGNGAITVIGLALIVWAALAIGRWAFVDSVWRDGADPCAGIRGACWAVITARHRVLLFGLYPFEEQWRSALACFVVIGMIVMTCMPAFWRPLRLVSVWIVGFTTFVVLMRGGLFGLAPVTSERWGGLSLTLFVYASTIVVGMPLSIALALMRSSEDRVIRGVAAGIVDFVRSIPLIAVVFAAALFGPFILPDALNGDKVYRVIAGFALFFAAYQSTIIRGGIQGVGAGQYEASRSLGLGTIGAWWLVILPQAFRNCLPATVNQFVSTFKDTSILVIVGLFELMASANVAFQTGKWSDYFVEVYVFVGLIYFAFAYSLSRYGAFLERKARLGLD